MPKRTGLKYLSKSMPRVVSDADIVPIKFTLHQGHQCRHARLQKPHVQLP